MTRTHNILNHPRRLATLLFGGVLIARLIVAAGPTDFGGVVDVAAGYDPDICVDANGDLHFAYCRGAETYYRKLNAPYTEGRLGREIFVGSGVNPQIEVDSNDRPHIVFGQAYYSYMTASGSFSSPIQAFSAWRKNFVEVDENDNVFVVADIYQPRAVGVKVYRAGVEQMSYIVDIGPDNPGGVALDEAGVLHSITRWKGVHYYSQFKYPEQKDIGKVPREAVQSGTSDFASIAVDPTDQSVHYAGTVGYAKGIFYKVRTARGWGATRNLDDRGLAHDGDHVNPCIAADIDGYKYVAYSVWESEGTMVILDANENVVMGPTVFGYEAGGKMTNPNVASRPDMSGAFVTWGTEGVSVRSVGDISLGGSTDAPMMACDFDGDGVDDVAVFDPANGGWHIRQSRDGYINYSWGISGDVPVPADYDGSGNANIAVFRPSELKWFIRNADGETTEIQWGLEKDIPVPGDYDKDGLADIAVYRPEEGIWYIRRSKDDGTTVRDELIPASLEEGIPMPADYDGDGFMDIAYFLENGATWHYVRSSDDGIVERQWGTDGDMPVPADYDGDQTDDICIFRPASGMWIGWGSTAGFFEYNWGAPDDVVAPGDYDGDRSADLTIFRASTGRWYVRSSITGTLLENAPIGWGMMDDWPVPGDYDGDEEDDIAVFRPANGNWYIRGSTGQYQILNWGAPGDRAVQADYDGDGLVDPAIFRESDGRWHIRSSGGEYRSIQWGAWGDWPVSGNYFRSNEVNVAVFRPSTGTWYIRDHDRTRKDDQAVTWGAPGDWPVPYDYDEDGITDVAIYRPTTGQWIGWLSTDGYAERTWGTAGDWPLPGLGPENVAVYRAEEQRVYIAGQDPVDMGSSAYALPAVMDYDGDATNEPALFQFDIGSWWIKQSKDAEWAKAPGPLPWAWSSSSEPIGARK